MLFPILVWTWWWQKAVLAAEDSLSLWADGSQGAVGWERGVSHLVAPVGHSGESYAFFSQKNWLLSTVSWRCALEFLMLPLCWVRKMLPRRARRSSYWFSGQRFTNVPPNLPCRIKNKRVFIKLLLLSVPQSVYSGGRADRTRSSAFSSPSFPRIQSFSGLWQTILQSVTPLFSSHLGVLYCHMPSSMLSEAYFLSEKRVLS